MGTLACHCIEGPQTFEKLAELMSDVHARFELEGKITWTVTDNRANFLKSFRKFGPRSGLAATASCHQPRTWRTWKRCCLLSDSHCTGMRGKMELMVAMSMTLMTRFTYPPVVIIMCMWQTFWKRALRRADFTSSRNICAVLRIP
jgi:hypothetical protein